MIFLYVPIEFPAFPYDFPRFSHLFPVHVLPIFSHDLLRDFPIASRISHHAFGQKDPFKLEPTPEETNQALFEAHQKSWLVVGLVALEQTMAIKL